MAKAGLLNIDTTNTFQVWLDRTNEIVDIIKSDAITASTLGDTTGSTENPKVANLFGTFSANTVIANTRINSDKIGTITGSVDITMEAPVVIDSVSRVAFQAFSAVENPILRVNNDSISWDIGFVDDTSGSFLINTGGGEERLKLDTNGNLTIAGVFNGDINGNVVIPQDGTFDASNATTFNLPDGFGIIPAGGIIMWSGSVASIPTGWAICNGSNGTPDLRDRFVVGAGSAYNTGDTGGSSSVTLTANQMPSHSHSFSGSTGNAGSHTHTLSINNAGSHSHSGSTNIAGAHAHRYTAPGDPGSAGGGGLVRYRTVTAFTSTEGAHSHSISINTAGSHSHSGSLSSAGSHSHSVSGTIGSAGSGQAHENRPPYYALAFIMKL